VYWSKEGRQPLKGPPAERHDIPAMSAEELQQLQAQIRREKAQRQAAPDPRRQWTIPSFADHAMLLYLENVRRFVVGNRANQAAVGAKGPTANEPASGQK